MRIAQIAPLYESVPPVAYGGTERVVAWLTDALVELGHDVTLFASGDSHTRARLIPAWPKALRLDPTIRDPMVPHMLLLETVRRHADEFDVLHFHLDYTAYSLFSRQPVPYLATVHGRLDWPEIQIVLRAFGGLPLVSLSAPQRAPLPELNWVDTIGHGMPAAAPTSTLALAPSAARQGPRYLAFLGRIAPEKRVDRAIRIAARCGMRLRIAAKIDAADRDYYQREIAPLMAQPHVDFIGEISDHQKADFFAGAQALLFPIDWDEPFGLVMIEAMACGVPVVAFGRGSVPEVIDEGVTGFIVESEEQAVRAVQRVGALPRAAIRQVFEQRFSAARMAERYLAVYRKLQGN